MRTHLLYRNIVRATRRRPAATTLPAVRRSIMSQQTTPTQQPAGDGGRPGTSSAAPAEAAAAPEEQPRAPALPEPPKDGDAPVTNLSVGGEGVRLDHLGPLVVNQDGTMSRISNWDAMSEIERQNTLRILGKRNQLRLKKLRDDAGVSAQEPTSEPR